MVTHRPGRGSPALLVIALLGAVAVAWIMSKAGDAGARWDAGAPVLVEVSGVVTDDTSVVTEYGASRSWSVRTRDLDRIGAAELGSQVQARLTGECRCELMLQEPEPVPRWTIGAMLFMGAAAVPGLLARRRWRRLPGVLAGRSRPATLEPVWLRRPVGTTAWAARFSTADPEGGERSSEADLVVELAGTPASWFPSDGAPVDVFGPDRHSGLTVFRSTSGLAVGSSAARPVSSVATRLRPWSGTLALATGLTPPPEPRAVDVGGRPYQRLSVEHGGEVGAAGSLVLRAESTRKGQGLVVVAVYALWIVAFQVLQPSAPWAAVGVVATLVGLWVLRRTVAARLAGCQPFASWSDRGAAEEAALAAAALGFVPARIESTERGSAARP